MKKLYYIIIALTFISCKKYSKEEIKKTDTIEVTKIQEEKTKQKEDCYDYLTELVRSSNFPFKDWNITPDKINLIIDEDNKHIIRAKLFFETNGTGTIGWIEYNINNKILLNTSANLEKPEKLNFKLDWALSLEKCLGIIHSEKNKKKLTDITLENIYNDASEIKLPIQYSYDFINDVKKFVSLPSQLYSTFKLEGVENYQMAKLPKYSSFNPILLEVNQPSGQSQLYLVILDKYFKMIDKRIMYSNREVDQGSINITYEITSEYKIKTTEALITNETSKTKETNKKTENYIINSQGFIVKD